MLIVYFWKIFLFSCSSKPEPTFKQAPAKNSPLCNIESKSSSFLILDADPDRRFSKLYLPY